MKSKILSEILSEVTPEIESKVEQKTLEKMEANKENSFLDLSKLSEEQQRKVMSITGITIEWINYAPYLIHYVRWQTSNKNFLKKQNLTELTYTQFIEMMGGESKEVLQVENNGWIKIESEKDLPEINQNVIIYDGLSVKDFYYFNNLKEFRSFYEVGGRQPISENVTHWMPLPEPPKD